MPVQDRVLRDVGHERGLSHRRSSRDHDEVARLKAAGQLVDVLEPGRCPGQRRLGD